MDASHGDFLGVEGLGIALSAAAAIVIMLTAFVVWGLRHRLSAFRGLMILLAASFVATTVFLAGADVLGLTVRSSWPGGTQFSFSRYAWALAIFPLLAVWFLALERDAAAGSPRSPDPNLDMETPPARPWLTVFTASVVLTYAAGTLGGVLLSVLQVSGSSAWTLAIFFLTALGSPMLAFAVLCHGSPPAQSFFRKVCGILALVVSLPMIGFAAVFLQALAQERGGWHPAPDEAVIVPLIWLGAVLLPWCGWRLSRETKQPVSPGADYNPLPVMEFWQAMEAGDYARAWAKTALYFQRDLSQDKWVRRMEELRRPLGKAVSRETLSTVFTNPGRRFEQVVLSTFDTRQSATETVFCALQADGEWRIEKYELGRPKPCEPQAGPAPSAGTGRDVRTKSGIFGIPWVHVASGTDPATGRPRVAKGIVAVGPTAIGVVAVGLRAFGLAPVGLVAVGGFPTGLLGLGFIVSALFAFGFETVGLVSVGLDQAVGLLTVTPQKFGLPVLPVTAVSLLLLAAFFAVRMAATRSQGESVPPVLTLGARSTRAVLVGLAVFVLITLTAVVFTLSLPKSYESAARIRVERVSAARDESGRPAPFYDPYFIQTEFEVIQSQWVLNRVIQQQNLKEVWGRKYGVPGGFSDAEALQLLRQCLTLRPVRSTSLIEIQVFSNQPDEAALIANAVANNYARFREEQRAAFLREPKPSDASSPGLLTLVEIIEPAAPALRPVRPNVPLNIAVGALVALLAGLIAGGLVLAFPSRAVRNIVLAMAGLPLLLSLGLLGVTTSSRARSGFQPQRLDSSRAPTNGLVTVRVVGVSQQGRVALVRLHTETASAPLNLGVSFSGPVSLRPFVAAAVTNVDCLLAPRDSAAPGPWMAGEILSGTNVLRVPGEWSVGFGFDDDATAARAVQQIYEVNLGRTFGLDRGHSLMLFALLQGSGKEAWSLSGQLHLSGPPPATGRTNSSATFSPVCERTLPLSDLGYSYSLNLESGEMQPMPASMTMADWSTGIQLPDGIIVIAPATNRALTVAGTGTQLVPLLKSASSWDSPRPAQWVFRDVLEAGQTVSVTGESSSPPVTFAFRTAKGARGLLQVTGFAENPRRVNLRYKWVQAPVTTPPVPPGYEQGQPAPLPPGYGRGQAPPIPPAYKQAQNTVATPSVPPAPAKSLSFGPVIERAIGAGEEFDLDAGKRVPWFGSGADLSVNAAGDLFARDIVVMRWDAGTWNLLAETVTYYLGSSNLNAHSSAGYKFDSDPMTYAIRTSEGSTCLLQFIGRNDSPHGVQIRYKLVPSGAATPLPATERNPPSPDYDRAALLFNEIEDFGHEFDAALASTNLAAAQTGIRRLQELLTHFNAAVQGTDCRFPDSLLEAVAKVRSALDAGDLDGALLLSAHNEAFARDFRRIASRMNDVVAKANVVPFGPMAGQAPLAAAVKAIEAAGGGVVRDAAGRVVKVHLIYARHDAHDNPYGDSLNTNTTDAASQWFPAFQDAQQLMLYRGQATDRALPFVARMTNLTVLGINEGQVTDAGLWPLTNLVQLRELYLLDSGLTDQALPLFSRLPKLDLLSMSGNHFTDDGLRSLTNLTHLKRLWIGSSQGAISDTGVQHLASLRDLEELDLQHTHLTDAGLEHLRGLVRLRKLLVSGTQVTPDGIKRLEKAIPGLKVDDGKPRYRKAQD